MLAHWYYSKRCSHSLKFSLTLVVLWVVALSSTNKVLHFKQKNEYFLQTSDIHFNIIFSLLHVFSFEYANSLLLSTLINFCNFVWVTLPSFALKFNKGDNFCAEARTFKIAVTLQFSCPCVLIFTFLNPIFCTVVHGSIFKYKEISSLFAIAFNSKSYLLLNLML